MYHNKKFKLVTSSKNSEISSEMIFTYKQKGTIVTCTYNDAAIQIGHLIGFVDTNGTLKMSYLQINNKNEIMTGTCISTPQILENKKIRLHEKWEWTSGDFSKGSSILEEI
jgi:DNA-directed RNA polymerase subunit E'/Rpb7